MAVKKIPQRMCTGCGQMRDKKSLLRIVCTPEGEIVPDTTGRLPGRGAYLCPNADCLKKALKTKRLERSLKAAPDPKIQEKLEPFCPPQPSGVKETDA